MSKKFEDNLEDVIHLKDYLKKCAEDEVFRKVAMAFEQCQKENEELKKEVKILNIALKRKNKEYAQLNTKYHQIRQKNEKLKVVITLLEKENRTL